MLRIIRWVRRFQHCCEHLLAARSLTYADLPNLSISSSSQINDPTMDTFKVTIDREKNLISVYNNGKGIPIEIHSKEKIWIPEMIFGHL